MPFFNRKTAGLIALALMLAGSTPASAGLLETLFGSFRRSNTPQAYAPDPLTGFLDRLTGNNRGQVAAAQPAAARGFCVRTCDGAHFPVQSRAGISAAEACSSFCPASPTKLFAGGNIDTSVAADGERYADMDNAYLYRTQFVPSCTCNGKPAGGLATLDAKSDPSLRPGDIVATGDGLVAFTGKGNKTANFTPVDAARFNRTEREKLANMKVTPVPDEDVTATIPADMKAPVPERRRSERQPAGNVVGQR